MKKPLFGVYVRMKTDERFRKEYVALNKINTSLPISPRKSSPIVKKQRTKCVTSIKKRKIRRVVSVSPPTPPPSLPPIYVGGSTKKKHIRLSNRSRCNRTLDHRGKGKSSLKGWDIDEDSRLHRFHQSIVHDDHFEHTSMNSLYPH